MKGKVSIEHEGVIYERQFAVDDGDEAKAILKDIVGDINDRFLKTPRTDTTESRRRATVKPLGTNSSNAGGLE